MSLLDPRPKFSWQTSDLLVVRLALALYIPLVTPWLRKRYSQDFAEAAEKDLAGFTDSEVLDGFRDGIESRVLHSITLANSWYAVSAVITEVATNAYLAVVFGMIAASFIAMTLTAWIRSAPIAVALAAAVVVVLSGMLGTLVVVRLATLRFLPAMFLASVSGGLIIIGAPRVSNALTVRGVTDRAVLDVGLVGLGVLFAVQLIPIAVALAIGGCIDAWRVRKHCEEEAVSALCYILYQAGRFGEPDSRDRLVWMISRLARSYRACVSRRTAVPLRPVDVDLAAFRLEFIRRRVLYVRRLKRLTFVDAASIIDLELAVGHLLKLAVEKNWTGFPVADDDVVEANIVDRAKPFVRRVAVVTLITGVWAVVQFAPLPILDPVRSQAILSLSTAAVLLLLYWIDPGHHDVIRGGLSSGASVFRLKP